MHVDDKMVAMVNVAASLMLKGADSGMAAEAYNAVGDVLQRGSSQATAMMVIGLMVANLMEQQDNREEAEMAAATAMVMGKKLYQAHKTVDTVLNPKTTVAKDSN